MASTTKTKATVSVTCGRCDGKGRLGWANHYAEGVCFACGGAGTIEMKREDYYRIRENADRVAERAAAAAAEEDRLEVLSRDMQLAIRGGGLPAARKLFTAHKASVAELTALVTALRCASDDFRFDGHHDFAARLIEASNAVVLYVRDRELAAPAAAAA